MSGVKEADVAVTEVSSPPSADIEHATVVDDPREWSRARKLTVVATVSAASMIAGLGANIYNPSIAQIEEELDASSGAMSLSLSLYILLLGSVPLLWSALSEFWGRKKVYVVSTVLGMVGSIVGALAKDIEVLVGMRCLQGVGASAVGALGAATLADMYEPRERGTMMGVYYSAPLLGPALGPIVGGVLTEALSWRATFWFMAIFIGACLVLFVPFKDTFRRERSLTYQAALRKRGADQTARRCETTTAVRPERGPEETVDATADSDVEKQRHAEATRPVHAITLSPADVNPAKPLFHVLRRRNNVATAIASGTCLLTALDGAGTPGPALGLYSLWARLIVLSDLLILLVSWKGRAWRQKWELKDNGPSSP